ncbi:hypothetical protein [Caballeronia sp. Sq4a]|uniref:hypothetical protein n=1 Tax=Caballeronia sp. Sq4a TaxID=2878152 RepID=UPI0020C164EC|nr:hypothetical protein [Caballeronia sp. Sq4a]
MPLDALRQMAKKLEVQMPLFKADTDAARAALATMKAETMQMNAAYAKDLVRTVQIRIQFEERRAA